VPRHRGVGSGTTISKVTLWAREFTPGVGARIAPGHPAIAARRAQAGQHAGPAPRTRLPPASEVQQPREQHRSAGQRASPQGASRGSRCATPSGYRLPGAACAQPLADWSLLPALNATLLLPGQIDLLAEASDQWGCHASTTPSRTVTLTLTQTLTLTLTLILTLTGAQDRRAGRQHRLPYP
jgi:hypothetical protein